jgi:hypothetical protein
MAAEIHVRVYEELNDFLPPDKLKRRFAWSLHGAITVKKLLEELGLPRVQVDLVLVNGRSVGLSRTLKPDDFVSIYPVFESLDLGTLVRLRKLPLRRTRFLAGPGLLWLARYLRRAGFDTLDFRHGPLEKVVCMAERERRIVLTRNSALMNVPGLSRIYLVRERNPRRQLMEVLSRFDLFNSAHYSQLERIIGRISPARS